MFTRPYRKFLAAGSDDVADLFLATPLDPPWWKGGTTARQAVSWSVGMRIVTTRRVLGDVTARGRNGLVHHVEDLEPALLGLRERLAIYGMTTSAYDPADDAVIAAATAGTAERMRGQLVVVSTTTAMVLILRFCWYVRF